MSRLYQLLLLGIIVIGFPFFAWYYLNKGTQMRKLAMQHLAPKGMLSNFQTATDQDSVISSEGLSGKRWIIGIIPADSSRQENINEFKKIIAQVSGEFSTHVFTIIGLELGEQISQIGQQLDLPRKSTWFSTFLAKNHVFPFSSDAFSLPEKYLDKPLIVLLDENGQIRNYYSLNLPDEVKTAIREIPVFLSLKQ